MILRGIEEVTFGTTPGGSPTFIDIPFTSETISQEEDTSDSETIRSDRQVADVARTNLRARGDTNHNFAYGQFDTLIRRALLSADWSSAVAVGPITTISFESIATSSTTNPKILDSASGFGSINVGEWVKVIGDSVAANNTWCKVLVQSTGTLEVLPANAANDFTDDAAGDSVTVTQGSQVVNGVSEVSHSLEKEFVDVSKFKLIPGAVIERMGMTIPALGRITNLFGWLAQKDTRPAATAAGSTTAAPSNPEMIGNAAPKALILGGASFDFIEMGWTLNNNASERTKAGTEGLISVGFGQCTVEGTLQAYFEGQDTPIDNALAFTTTDLALVLEDRATSPNSYVLDWPEIKTGQARTVGGGVGEPVLLDLPWKAKREATEDVTFRIVRFPGP